MAFYSDILNTSKNINQFRDEINEARDISKPFDKLSIKYNDNPDYIRFKELLSEFIKQGFNPRESIEDEELKICPDNEKTWRLPASIIYKLYHDHDRREIKQNYSKIESNMSNRAARRRLTKEAKKAKFHVINEGDLYESAKLWYKARVIYGSLTITAEKYGSQISTLSHKIDIFDQAAGYARKK